MVGASTMIANLQKYKKAYLDLVADALYQELLIVLAEAQQLTPVDTGVLVSSAYVRVARVTKNGITLAYGFSAPYAVYVHENLEAYHNNGQAKFLETAINNATPDLLARVARRVQAALTGSPFPPAAELLKVA